MNVNATEEEPIFIGARNEFRVEKLPLTPAEDFLATEQQRARIVKRALDDLLDATNANRVDWSTFDLLRDQIKCRTGINDAAVSLVLFTRLR